MNRLLAKKKPRGNGTFNENTSSHLSATTQMLASGKEKGWRKKKDKPEYEPEEEFDIKTALPSAENFRTSLMLPNLSTRFSMLKEQDDPFSILGKASDDSVLAPKRRSRLGDFGFHSPLLSDIAEVSSFRSSVNTKPSLVPQRNGSYTYGEDYGTDDDSSHNGTIMGRARPGEGNMLFGGRQKIYRIPIGDSGAVSNLGGSEQRGMRGRALYGDDVSMSAFQKLREEEKERVRLEKDMEMDGMNRDGLDSPALSYNERRETASSTNSGPSMMSSSTAPTSVAASSPSLPPIAILQSNPTLAVERPKSRKLYEQGLEQHMQEQQTAALTRLASLKRNASLTGPNNGPYRSRSASNINDGFEASASASVRTASPLPISEHPASSNSSQHRPSIDQPSASLPSSSHDDLETEKRNALWLAMDPLDRGMATAMGTFNRPKKFSEEQFLQRQMSLMKQQPRKASMTESTKSSASRPCVHGSQTVAGEIARSSTTRTDRSWSASSISDDRAVINTSPSKKISSLAEQKAISTGAFLTAHDSKNDGDDSELLTSKIYQSPEQSLPQSFATDQTSPRRQVPVPITTHPTMRSSASSSPQRNKEKRRAWSPDELQSGLAAAGGPHKEYLNIHGDYPMDGGLDVGSLPNGDNPNIQGLVREHLRQISNSSSIYPARTPGPDTTDFSPRYTADYDTASPWDVDERDDEQENGLEEPGYDVPKFTFDSNEKLDPPTAALASDTIPLRGLGLHQESENGADWEQELNKQHARGASTETAYEREAFASELAERQRTIQQNLKAKAEYGASSPQTSYSRNVFESSIKQFSMLRGKPSGESLQPDREVSNGPTPSIDRSYSKTRVAKERAMSPPIGRTLHMKMPRENEGGSRNYPAEYSGAPQPSAEFSRPSLDGRSSTAPSRAPPTRSSPPESSRSSSSKQRSNSELSLRGGKHKDGSLPRPSLETTRPRRDSGNGKSPISPSSPDGPKSRAHRSRRHNLTQISTSSPRMSPIDPSGSAAYSSTSTPPYSADSISNQDGGSSVTSASASVNAQTSPGHREQDGPPTGFFFPAAGVAPSSDYNPKPNTVRRNRKNTITKGDISEPTLINSTSAVTTVELPPGASLQNGLRDDFDVVLMGGTSTAPAPSPTIPTGDKPRKGGFLAHFGRKEGAAEREKMANLPDYEPETRRFRIRRLEAEDRSGAGKPMHRAYRAGENSSIDDLGRGMF